MERPRLIVKNRPHLVGFDMEIPIAKMSEDERIAFGWASKSMNHDGSLMYDRQGDFILPSDVEKAAYEYVLKSRNGGAMHITKGGATLIESMVFTDDKIAKMGLPAGIIHPGSWWVGYKVHDEALWDGIKTGVYKAFSVGGRGKRQSMTAEDALRLLGQ